MKYINTKTNEVWDDSQTSTKNTSNFYLLSHDEKVAQGWTLVPEMVIEQTFESMKDTKLFEVDVRTSNSILERYPFQDQINACLGIYGEQYKQDMITFINSVRDKKEQFESDIESATTKTDLDFDVEFE